LCWASTAHGEEVRQHEVYPGETITGIAARYGCTVDQLLWANQDTVRAPDRIKPGQLLLIPDSCKGKPSASVPDTAPAKPTMKPEPITGKAHVVQTGESIWTIAARYGCTQQEIMEANRSRIQDPRLIQIDQKIRIPKCTGVRRTGGRVVNDCSWVPDDIEVGKLKELMRARGFRPPPKFRALLIKTVLSKDQRRIQGHRLVSWSTLATSSNGWNPASTVKLYSAISALEMVRRNGFNVNTRVTFHYPRGKRTFKLKDLFEDAVHWSKNLPHNRLVQLAGFDFLNGPGGTLQRAGLNHTYVMRAYAETEWTDEGHSRWLRHSPRITLRQGRRDRTIAPREGEGRYPCMGAACTTLSDLAKTLCRMMLHEQLPTYKRLRLGGDAQSPHLKLLRQSMDRKRQGRQDAVWDIIQRHFPQSRGYELFRKAGFAREWLSDNIYIYNPGSRRRWIITLAGYPGRGALTRAADVVSKIILADDL
jgi:LysM repeat protein